MGPLFGKPKSVEPPRVQPAAAIPEVGEEASEAAIRRARQRRGFRRTIITGALTPTPTGKKQLLG